MYLGLGLGLGVRVRVNPNDRVRVYPNDTIVSFGAQGKELAEILVSVSTDGRVTQWHMKKGCAIGLHRQFIYKGDTSTHA